MTDYDIINLYWPLGLDLKMETSTQSVRDYQSVTTGGFVSLSRHVAVGYSDFGERGVHRISAAPTACDTSPSMRAYAICCVFALQLSLAAACEVSADPAVPNGCGLPGKLANFQGNQADRDCDTRKCAGSAHFLRAARNCCIRTGYFECDSEVVVGKPRSLTELQDQVLQYDRVKAVGVGHSWWQQQFCSGKDSNSVNIVLTQMNNTLTA